MTEKSKLKIEVEEGMDNEDIYEKVMEEFKEDWIELSPDRDNFVVTIEPLNN